ncbi:MAG: hypothetical protein AAF982_01620 [Pseudomonadota bacterium]
METGLACSPAIDSPLNEYCLYALSCHLGTMPGLSIDITPERHKKLKTIAALKGQSVENYVLKRTLGDVPSLGDISENAAMAALADFLEPRIAQARRGEFSAQSVADIRREARKQAGLQPAAWGAMVSRVAPKRLCTAFGDISTRRGGWSGRQSTSACSGHAARLSSLAGHSRRDRRRYCLPKVDATVPSS